MKKAFTLIELLVSIGIIATLTAILLPNFMGARERARDAQKIQDAGALKNALRMYYNDKQAYPTPAGSNTLDVGMSAYTSFNGVGTTNFYRQVNNGDGFQLCVRLENGQGNDDTDSQAKCGASGPEGVCWMGVGITADKLYVICAN